MKTTYTTHPETKWNFSNASRFTTEHHDADIESGKASPQLMAELGITFDGRSYRYEDYRYDRLADAINYAQLMRVRAGTA